MAAAAAPRFICFLCKRKFQSAQLLARHKQLSELHHKNLRKQEEEIQQQKEELRQSIGGVRREIYEVDQSLSRQAQPDPNLQTNRQTLELKLRQNIGEYGQVQEKLEASRYQQLADKSAEGSIVLKVSEVKEMTVGNLLLSVAAATWQGNKEVQEDRYMIDIKLTSPEGTKIQGFCVLDGHSGSLCVDSLLEWFPKNLQKCLSAKLSLTDETLKQAVTEACILTDDEFLARAREREVLDGSTLLLALIYPTDGKLTRYKLLLANVGDSRAVMCRSSDGQLLAARLTDDHKPGRADERRRIEMKGGLVEMQGVWRVFTPSAASFGGRSLLWGLAVSRAFGDLLMKEPQRYGCHAATGELVTVVPEVHIYDLSLSDDRFLVLACDGIWDVISDEDAVAVCSEHRSTELAAHALTRRAFEVGSDDNLTTMVIAWQLREPHTIQSESKKARVDGID